MYESKSPASLKPIASVQEGTLEEYNAAVDKAKKAWSVWADVRMIDVHAVKLGGMLEVGIYVNSFLCKGYCSSER